jgi:hypothetical protein
MVKHIYKNFFSSKKELNASRQFWRELCHGVIPSKDAGLWKITFPETLIDDDSHQILNCYNESANKRFDITQAIPKHQEVRIGGHMDKLGEGFYEKPIDCFCLWCELSTESAEIAKKLIGQWVRPDITIEMMDKIISKESQKHRPAKS